MFQLYKPPHLGDEIVLRSTDWLENFPWRQENTINIENDKCVIYINVKDYTPEEIKVKTADGFVIVEAKHEEKKDEQGFISRQFRRRYQLPAGCRLEEVTSKLSSCGILTIVVPRQSTNASLKQETVIPVSHEGGKVKAKL